MMFALLAAFRDGKGQRVANDMACERQNGMIKKFARDNTVSGLQKSANTIGLLMKCRTRYCVGGKGMFVSERKIIK